MITLFTGNEPYKMKCELDRIRMEYGDLGVSEHESLTESVYADCRQAALFAPKKAVVVWCSGILEAAGFAEYLEAPSDYSDLYLIDAGMDKRSAVYRMCTNEKKSVVVKKRDKVSKDSFVKMCEGMIKRKGYLVKESTLFYLYEYTGYAEDDACNLFEISTVIKQMCCQTEHGAEILPELIEIYANPCQDAVIWELSDALFSKDRSRLLTLGERLLASGENPIAMLSALIRQFRLAYKMKVLSGNERELSAAIGVQVARLKKVCAYPESIICEALHTLQNRVNEIKRGNNAVAVFRAALCETQLLLCEA